MFSHIMLGANDIEVSKKFYDATLAVLGCDAGKVDPKGRCFYITKKGVFAITTPLDGQLVVPGNGSTMGFAAEDTAQADAWYEAALANGGTSCEDPPGRREGAAGGLYLAYVRDPAGNKICVLHRMG